MDYIILILVSIISCFAICFASQLHDCKSCEGKSKLKLFLPRGKENIIVFIVLMVMLTIIALFIEYVYSNTLIYNMKLVLLLAILCPAAYTDWKDHIIHNSLILSGLCIRAVIFVIELINDPTIAIKTGTNELIVAVVIFIIGFLSALILKSAIGMGDIKLITIMALFQGASGIVCSVLISLIVSFFYCMIALIGKRKGKKDVIPFAPSLLMGTYISILLFGM